MDLACEFTHSPTGGTIAVTSFDFSQRFDTLSRVTLGLENAYRCSFGDAVTFKFWETNTSIYQYEFYGIVRGRNLKNNTIMIADYGSVLDEIIYFDRYKYDGEDYLLACKDIVEEVDDNNLIDVMQLHGTEPSKFISFEDNIFGNNHAWNIVKDIVGRVVDDSNNYYVLPYHIWFDEKGIMLIEKQRDIEDSTNYPAAMTLGLSDIIDVKLREDDDNIVNVCICENPEGERVTVTDANSITKYSRTTDYRKHYKKIFYDDINLDSCQEKAREEVILKREPQAQYDIQIVDGHFININDIIYLDAERWGLDGRFLVTGKRMNHELKTVLTCSGERLSIADVI